MRRPLSVAVAALALLVAGETVALAIPEHARGRGRGRPGAEMVDPLRLNDLQARGTHNSYHRDPGHPFGDAVGWDYSHHRLATQLEEQDVRQVELDIHYNWARDDFEVYHAWFGDDRSTCELLTDCLAELRDWSDAHPGHHPLLVLIEPKDAGPPKNAELPEDGDPFTRPFTAAEYEKLDRVLLDAFATDGGGDRVVTPDDVTVPGSTLRDSILGTGWPRLDDVRQHVLYVVDGDDHAEPYSDGWRTLAGRSMFVQASPADDVAAFVSRSATGRGGDVDTDKYRRMANVVANGFMVRDLAGPDGDGDPFDRPKAAGAHFISSDHPDQLVLSGDDRAPSRCNPVTTAGRACDDLAIEVHDHAGSEPYPTEPDPSDGTDQVVADRVDRLVVRSVESAEAAVRRAAEGG